MVGLVKAFLAEFVETKKHRNRKRHKFMVRGGRVYKNVQRRAGYRGGKHMSTLEQRRRKQAAHKNAMRRRIYQKRISTHAARAYVAKMKRGIH